MPRFGGSGGSSSWSSISLLTNVRTIINTMGWKGLGQSLVGTVMLAIVFAGIDLLNAIISLPTTLLHALSGALAELNAALLEAPAEMVTSAIGAAAGAFGSGWTGLLGPFQGPLGVGIALVMVWEVLYFMDVVDTDFVGVVIDLPLINNDESEADPGED